MSTAVAPSTVAAAFPSGTTGTTSETDTFGPWFGRVKNVYNKDQYDNEDREAYELPAYYRGKNVHLQDIVMGILWERMDWETSVALPYVFTDNPNFAWNLFKFDGGLPAVVPHLGVSRMISHKKEQYSGATIRRGISFYLEHGFMDTPDGRENYRLNIITISQSIADGDCHDVVYALLEDSQVAADQARHAASKLSPEDFIEREINQWGVMQKGIDQFTTIIQSRIQAFKLVTMNKEPDMLIIPSGAKIYITSVDPIATRYLFSGPRGVNQYRAGPEAVASFQNLKVFEFKQWNSEESGVAIDLSVRKRTVAQFVRMGAYQERSDPKSYSSAGENVEMYSYEANKLQRLTLDFCVDNCFRFSKRASRDVVPGAPWKHAHDALTPGGNGPRGPSTDYNRYFSGQGYAIDPAVYAVNGRGFVIQHIGDIEPAHLDNEDVIHAAEAFVSHFFADGGAQAAGIYDQGIRALATLGRDRPIGWQELQRDANAGGGVGGGMDQSLTRAFVDNFRSFAAKLVAAFPTSVFLQRGADGVARAGADDNVVETLFNRIANPASIPEYVRGGQDEARTTSQRAQSAPQGRVGGLSADEERQQYASASGMNQATYNAFAKQWQDAFAQAYFADKAEKKEAEKVSAFPSHAAFSAMQSGAPVEAAAVRSLRNFAVYQISGHEAAAVPALYKQVGDGLVSAMITAGSVMGSFVSGKKKVGVSDRARMMSAFLYKVNDLVSKGRVDEAKAGINAINERDQAAAEAFGRDALEAYNAHYGAEYQAESTSATNDKFINTLLARVSGSKIIDTTGASAGSAAAAGEGNWVHSGRFFTVSALKKLSEQSATEQTSRPSASPVDKASAHAGHFDQAAYRRFVNAGRRSDNSFVRELATLSESTSSIASIARVTDFDFVRNLSKRSARGGKRGLDYAGQEAGEGSRNVSVEDRWRNFNARFDAIGEESNPFVRIAAWCYIGSKYHALTLKRMIANNVPLPFEFLVIRYALTFEMGSAILMRSGKADPTTGFTAFGQGNAQVGDNVGSKWHYFNFTYRSKAFVKDYRNVMRLEDVMFRRYVGGGGLRPAERPSDISLATLDAEGDRPSVVVFMNSRRQREDVADKFDMSGFWQHWFHGTANGRPNQQITCAGYYAMLFSLLDYLKNAGRWQGNVKGAFRTNDNRPTTIACETYHRRYNPVTKRYDIEELGSGHQGQYEVKGTRRACNRDGLMMLPTADNNRRSGIAY